MPTVLGDYNLSTTTSPPFYILHAMSIFFQPTFLQVQFSLATSLRKNILQNKQDNITLAIYFSVFHTVSEFDPRPP